METHTHTDRHTHRHTDTQTHRTTTVTLAAHARRGLTRAALVGERKQSVIDVERLFGPNLADFFRSRGYHYEVKYVEAMWKWRRACDHRGLSELEDVILTISFLTYSLMT